MNQASDIVPTDRGPRWWPILICLSLAVLASTASFIAIVAFSGIVPPSTQGSGAVMYENAGTFPVFLVEDGATLKARFIRSTSENVNGQVAIYINLRTRSDRMLSFGGIELTRRTMTCSVQDIYKKLDQGRVLTAYGKQKQVDADFWREVEQSFREHFMRVRGLGNRATIATANTPPSTAIEFDVVSIECNERGWHVLLALCAVTLVASFVSFVAIAHRLHKL